MNPSDDLDCFEDEESLADKIGAFFRPSTFYQPYQDYLPQSCLGLIVTQTSIREELDRLDHEMATMKRDTKKYKTLEKYNVDVRENLAEWIYSNAPKTFAAVVHCELEPSKMILAMAVFQERGLTDDSLLPARELVCRHFPAQLWGKAKLHDFCMKQWRFLVPVFSPDQYDYDLEPDCIFPFDLISTMHKAGAFSSVYRIKIHNAHNMHENLEDVALKEVNVGGDGDVIADKAWDDEARALKVIKNTNHPHIVKCIAAIKKGDRRYFMFPWAEGNNLRNFWDRHTRDFSRDNVLQVITQLRGIADALVYLHNYDNSTRRNLPENGLDIKLPTTHDSSLNGATQSNQDHEEIDIITEGSVSIRHGDLKPENILVFDDNETKLGTLKVADLGLAKQHVIATADRNAKQLNTSTRYGTQSYEAPEVATSKFARSRLYDIWSMGCITLEFIVWILYGKDHLTNFYNQIAGGDQLPYQYYETRQEEDLIVADVHRMVRKWIAHIRTEDPECKQESAIRDLLRIVEEKLLVVALPLNRMSSVSTGQTLQPPSLGGARRFRATAREFRDSLDGILKKKDQKNYLCTGKSRSSISPPTSTLSPEAVRQEISSRKSTSQGPLLTGVRGQQIRPDYSLPPLRDWQFPVDNAFADSIAPQVGGDFLPHSVVSSNLCDRCSELDFWTGGFSIDDTLTDLKKCEQTCDLCKMLLGAAAKEESTEDTPMNDRVQFVRRESKLYLTTQPFPVLSIVRPPNAKLTRQFQLGFPELPKPSTENFYEILNGWLADCNINHNDPNTQNRNCSGIRKDRLPTRLIDVGTIDAPVLRLIESETENIALKEEYIALSHPWGDTTKYRPFCTLRKDPHGTKHEIDEFKKAIPEHELPATFKDAISCTRRLKIRYLWIDSICIVQGPGGDFSVEAERMESVFSGAYCVLAASRAKDQRDGFLGERNQCSYITIQRANEKNEQPFFICEQIDNFNKDVIEGSLNKRGWVLQERALARRTIYFTDTQTYFECGYGVRCETMTRMHNYMADFLGDTRFPEKAMRTRSRALKIEYFQGLYKQYSRLNFTQYADRPIAITGLERRLRDAFGTLGGYGIFDDGNRESKDNGLFHRSLLWKRSEEDDEKREDVAEGKEPKIHWLEMIQFPPEKNSSVLSWSWMNYKGAIDYTDPPYQSADWEVKEITPPWTQGTFRGKPSIEAIVRDFNVAGAKPGEIRLTYDLDRSKNQQRAQCVVVARTKQPLDEKSKQIFVLLVTSTQRTTTKGRKEYRRAGVGVMSGKFITMTGSGIPASII